MQNLNQNQKFKRKKIDKYKWKMIKKNLNLICSKNKKKWNQKKKKKNKKKEQYYEKKQLKEEK